MSKKVTYKSIDIDSLISSDSVNGRLADNYDLPTLRAEVEQEGRITTPLIVEPIMKNGKHDGTYLVLQGNRRTRVAKQIQDDPSATDSLKKATEKLYCQIIEGLTEGERDDLIYDHGKNKPLNREETLLAVWRLYKSFKSEREIGLKLYYQLARFAGNEKKIATLPSDPTERAKAINKWFRGTLSQYMLAAAQMTPEVQEAMRLTERRLDGRLGDAKIPFYTKRERMQELLAAKTADEKAGLWKPTEGGPKFAECIERYKLEDANLAEKGKKKSTRPDVDELRTRMALYKSAAVRQAIAVAIGEEGAGEGLVSLDDAVDLHQRSMDVLAKHVQDVKNKDVKSVMMALLTAKCEADVEEALKPFLA